MNDYTLTAPSYERIAVESGYAATPPRLVKAFCRAVGSVPAAARILDFGCGTGRLTQELRNVLPEARVTGMEPCAAMAKRCEEKLRKDSYFSLLRTGYRSGQALPFCDERFDAVLSSGVFDHIRIDTGVMKEFLRVVKDDGYLAFTFERTEGNDDLVAVEDCEDYTFYQHSPAHVRFALEQAGAAVRREEKMPGYKCWRSAQFGLVVAQKLPTASV